jgi:hypothetical protein
MFFESPSLHPQNLAALTALQTLSNIIHLAVPLFSAMLRLCIYVFRRFVCLPIIMQKPISCPYKQFF